MKADLTLMERVIQFTLDNKLVVFLLLVGLIFWGILVAPFDWEIPGIARDPVPVDAIPDIGENQQIVFSEWMGRSPQDVEDQITYPLTVALLGIPEVRTIRSYSMFGYSTIYVIFNEEAEFYWSRSRILEKLNSLPANTLPEDVKPALGPDATALGQVFWYTLEGRDKAGNPAGGWDLHELRSVQDWYVRYGLLSADGVAEVASVGGFVREYQIDVDPAALRQHNIKLSQVFNAVRGSNVDVGARTVEINRVEYLVRGLGFIKDIKDIESTVVKVEDNVPLYVKDVAHVSLGPALRRGALDKEGSEAVGGVVVTRYGENPLATINNVKAKISEISAGLPSKTLPDGRVSQLTIVPFYDRTGLIHETLGTLNHALRDEILITIIVILVLLMHLRSSLLISSMMPLTVLTVFIAMKLFGVDANIVALSGIAIAIGTIVDMGIIVSENIVSHLEAKQENEKSSHAIRTAVSEVGGAVLTAVSTTVVSFLPVFTMQAAEGKLFRPLAFTKTFALLASILFALLVLPPLAHSLFTFQWRGRAFRQLLIWTLGVLGLLAMFFFPWWIAILLMLPALYEGASILLTEFTERYGRMVLNGVLVGLAGFLLSMTWAPLGEGRSVFANFSFVGLIMGVVLGSLWAYTRAYPRFLAWALDNKRLALSLPATLLVLGFTAWLGFGSLTSFFPGFVKNTRPYQALVHTFPGFGREFMPPLDEGSYLYMPTTMPHAGMEESLDVLRKIDMALYSVPEVEQVVGKIGRAETPLDPAPISMVETIVNYKSEYKTDQNGKRLKFSIDREGSFRRDDQGELIPDPRGKPFRQWREHIRTEADIWDELVAVARLPGTTSAPRLQPIAARIVMLQSGMRAPMGIKVKGPDLQTIESFGLQLESILKDVPQVNAPSVFADRIVGKPYLEIEIDRYAIARFGIPLRDVQHLIEVAIGGREITSTVEGRERYPVRVRYMREYRDDLEALEDILVPAPDGKQVPLTQLATINYVRGPQVIKSEDTFLIGYVLFDKRPGVAEVDVVEQAKALIEGKIRDGDLIVPPGVSYSFAGSYENQIRAVERLRIILPLALLLIFLILYFQFKSVSTSFIVFSGVFVAWAGGFVMLWLYGQAWFLNFSFFGADLRELFQVHTINLSVAVWVGFLALFGIATDDGVIISTYLQQTFRSRKPNTIQGIREAALHAGKRRIRPAMMTVSTTLLALLPVITSVGRGADVMVPMAIPTFGGMVFAVLSTLVAPILYTWQAERRLLSAGTERD
ncbi:MAG: efflux RND transporter permease subunit [Candidatus Marinimicrobia bacterium]|nr:efflux RND transporter permease subunit [Candidatus Neomarinimicrobiota bacterium]MCF7851574.1 efflux RND transporter permease subunit [Candidatus Neomarinimicrobiota bacterium]